MIFNSNFFDLLKSESILKYNISSIYEVPKVLEANLSMDMHIKATDFKALKAIILWNFLFKQKPIIIEYKQKRTNSIVIKLTIRKTFLEYFLLNLKSIFIKQENLNNLTHCCVNYDGIYTIGVGEIGVLFYLGSLPYDYYNWKNIVRINVRFSGRNRKILNKIQAYTFCSMLGINYKSASK